MQIEVKKQPDPFRFNLFGLAKEKFELQADDFMKFRSLIKHLFRCYYGITDFNIDYLKKETGYTQELAMKIVIWAAGEVDLPINWEKE